MKHLLALFALLVLPILSASASDSSPIPCDGKFEASFTLPNQTGNPFDPAVNDVDVTFTGPRKLKATVPAFWDGESWRVRYAPTVVGEYALHVMRNGQSTHPADLTPSHFHCVRSSDPGFIRRDLKVVQRFDFDNGKPYYPLGMNVAWTGGKGPDYPSYFADMSKAHMNWARVWMTFWDGKALEWSPDKTKNPKRGYFLMDAAKRWDMIFDNAARDGIYVQMVLQHHGQYTNKTDPNWQDNPFNVANGGFLKKPDDFFTDPEAKRLTKAKYRYIVARWGYSTHLLSYELFNEVQNITEAGSHFQDVVNWHKEMAAYIRSIDVNHHLITTSNSDPGTPLAGIGLSYDQVHTYPPDIISTFASVKTADLKTPVFYGEWGHGGSGPQTEEFLHDGLWASLMAPNAGAGQFWYGDQVMAHNWWPQFASAADFVRTLGLAGLGTCAVLHPSVDSAGARGDLSFAPPGGWEKTTRFDVRVPNGGEMPDLSGVSSYIQGQNNRAMMAQPIAFHIDAIAPCQFRVTIGTVAKSGAHPTLALDGKTIRETDFPASDKDHSVDKTLVVDVPAGPHTVSLFNTGPDWFVAQQITVTNYAPGVAVLARGNAHAAAFWAYRRDEKATTPLNATLAFPGFAPSNYTVRLWDPASGKPLPAIVARAGKSGLKVHIGAIAKDIAGVITRR